MDLPRLFTASYSDFDPAWGVPVRTSVGAPKWWAGDLDQVRRLTPYGLWDITDPTAFARRYFNQLDRAGVAPLAERFRELSARRGGRPLVFLCFEDVTRPGVWCHRQLLASWIERHMSVDVSELSRQPSLLDA